jgi:signal transduction histidine kinase
MLETLQETGEIKEVTKHIYRARNSVRAVMGLIRGGQKRGATLAPILRDCLINEEVVRPAIEYVRTRIEGTSIHLSYTLGTEDYHLRVDAELARDSLINILNNAIWAVKQNKRTSKREIFVSVRLDAKRKSVKIEIRDSGVGIDPGVFPNLFRPFFTTRSDGTGLGLFFSRLVVEQFGGTLNIVRSLPGKGTTVALILPLVEK